MENKKIIKKADEAHSEAWNFIHPGTDSEDSWLYFWMNVNGLIFKLVSEGMIKADETVEIEYDTYESGNPKDVLSISSNEKKLYVKEDI